MSATRLHTSLAEDLMGLMDQLGGLVQQYANGHVPATEQEAHQHYDQIAATVPKNEIASAIGPALGGLSTEAVRDRVTATAAQMDPQQRTSMVQSILGGLAPQIIPGLLGRLGISPSVAQNPAQASPTEIGQLAAHAKEQQPELFNRAMQIYAEHPVLVKTLGTVAIAKIAQQLSQR